MIIYFSWRDTDKIRSAEHDSHEVAGFWRCGDNLFVMDAEGAWIQAAAGKLVVPKKRKKMKKK